MTLRFSWKHTILGCDRHPTGRTRKTFALSYHSECRRRILPTITPLSPRRILWLPVSSVLRFLVVSPAALSPRQSPSSLVASPPPPPLWAHRVSERASFPNIELVPGFQRHLRVLKFEPFTKPSRPSFLPALRTLEDRFPLICKGSPLETPPASRRLGSLISCPVLRKKVFSVMIPPLIFFSSVAEKSFLDKARPLPRGPPLQIL